VLGHVLGAILMAFALRDSIPTIGWVAMLLTTPAHVVAFVVLQAPVLDMGAWLLMALSFALCARAILRTPDEHWDVPPATS
jgi:alpha-D-ribose 1-methylphosphonate 5-triphosphate synthase subunit PhnL